MVTLFYLMVKMVENGEVENGDTVLFKIMNDHAVGFDNSIQLKAKKEIRWGI